MARVFWEGKVVETVNIVDGKEVSSFDAMRARLDGRFVHTQTRTVISGFFDGKKNDAIAKADVWLRSPNVVARIEEARTEAERKNGFIEASIVRRTF
jgi:hypothetical protein